MIQKLSLVFILLAFTLYETQGQTNKAATSIVQPTKTNTTNKNNTSASNKTSTANTTTSNKSTTASKNTTANKSNSTSQKKSTAKKSYYIPANNEHVTAIKNKDLPYQFWVYTPEDYKSNKDKKYPMILFLHGRSSSGTNLDMVKRYGVIYELLRGMKLNFIVAAPQCQNGWDNKKLLQVLDYVQDNYRVHKDSTYLTGMSMGGYGAWMLAGAHPERFAAVAPVCGGGDLKQVSNLIEMPTWVFHGAKDKAVPISESQKMVDAIKAKKGKKIKFTIYKNDGHGELIKVFRMPELYQWFLEHKIENKDSKITSEENKKSKNNKSGDIEELSPENSIKS